MFNYRAFIGLMICLPLAIIVYGQEIEKDLFKPYGENSDNCYGKSLITAAYDTIVDKVKIRSGYSYLKRIPPVYDTIEERILVRSGYTKFEVTEPVFETVSEMVMVEERATKLNPSAKTFPRTLFEQVEISPSRKVWRKIKRKKNCKSKIPENCLDWTVVTVPASYMSIKREVPSTILKGNDANSILEIPSKSISIEKKILKTPGKVVEVDVFPEYKTIKKLVLKQKERYEEVPVPPVYKEIKRVQLISEGGTIEPKQVLCRKDYPRYLPLIQRKLQALGYEISYIDGVLGSQTKSAIVQYQQDNFLPIGQLDFDTLRKLEIIP